MPALDERKVDSHCHVLDPQRHPYLPGVRYAPTAQEIGTRAQFLAVCDAYRVDHALIVGPNSGYGDDNRCLLDMIAQGQGRFKGVAVVPNDAPEDQLARLQAQGITGIAVNATYWGVDHYLGIGPLLRRMEALGLFLQIQVEGDQLLALLPLIEASGVRLFVDHCGRPLPEAGVAQPGFAALLALGRAGRAVIKLSGLQKLSRQSFPYEDAWPYWAALVEAFGIANCVWGSDWPFLRAPERLDYGPLLSLVDRLLPRAEDRRAVLWDNPVRLFGFRS